jgi:RsmE family RNA methyltransferase
MNLLLLQPAELRDGGQAEILLSRYPPRAGLWPPSPGRRLRVGLRDGHIGSAIVTAIDGNSARLALDQLSDEPPASLPLQLILALPRPKMLRRVLRCAAEIGIKRIWLLNTARVEKSYWQSPLLSPANVDTWCAAGLEQAVDTHMPTVCLRQRFKPFVEDELRGIAAGTTCLVAHPSAATAARPAPAPITLAVGPEGGFTEYEVGMLQEAGFTSCSLGPRVLRVETALPVLAATLLPCNS